MLEGSTYSSLIIPPFFTDDSNRSFLLYFLLSPLKSVAGEKGMGHLGGLDLTMDIVYCCALIKPALLGEVCTAREGILFANVTSAFFTFSGGVSIDESKFPIPLAEEKLSLSE